VTSPSFAARARLPATWGAAAVDDRLASVRHRWNQFGLQAHVEVAADAGGIAVGYRLTVAGRPDADEVHAAFRADLDSVLAALSVPEPALGDLEAMARAQADEPAPTVRWTWEADTAV
jgi:hypothetical protein